MSAAPHRPDLGDDSLPPDSAMGPEPRIRAGVGAAAGIAAAIGANAAGWTGFAPLLGWTVTALTFTFWTWVAVWHMDPPTTASHATRETPGRGLTHLLLIAGALVSLIGVGALVFGHGLAPVATGVAIASVASSWATVHTVYALRYARMYYHGTDGGIDFNQSDPPTYTDFAYVAVTIGMSFAASDTTFTSSAFRKVALGHALTSYLFGTVIVALLVNLVAGLAG